MKTIFIVMLTSLLLSFSSCKQENHLSDAYGNFEARPVSVSPDVSGRLVFLDVQEGDLVQEGQLVAIVDTVVFCLNRDELRAQKEAVYSKLKNIDARVVIVEEEKKTVMLEMKRLKKLYDDGAATRQKMDEIEGGLRVLDSRISALMVEKASVGSEINIIDKKISLINDRIRRCYIKNPLQGTVLELYTEQYEMLKAGMPIYKVANLEQMELMVYVDAVQLANIKLGDNARVLIDKDAGSVTEMGGKIIWISSNAEFTPKIIQTRKERVRLVYGVKIIVKNGGYLRIGMPGEVIFGN